MQMMKWRRQHWFIILFASIAILAYWWRQNRLEARHDSSIKYAARRYGVEPALVKAIVWRESKFDEKARGRAGEIGLMQLREEAAQEWADAEHVRQFLHEHCFNPETNVMAGTWYLRKLLRRYNSTDNPVPYALADYNAGRGNVLKWINGGSATNSALFIEKIQFPGTKEYVAAVMRREEHYRKSETVMAKKSSNLL
jgi:soluble lytic murein transglycosylase